MITNLEIRKDDTAVAFGSKFDVAKVLDGMIAFLRAFASDLAAADPDIRPSIRFCGDGDRTAPLDDDAYARLRREIIGLSAKWDVAAWPVRVDIGPFALRAYPLGRDDLQRIGPCEPTLVTEEDWRELDPTPVIEFTPVKGIPIFHETALGIVKELIVLHAPDGARPDFERIPALRFPSAAYGIGLGTLRISLLTVPVNP